MNYLQRKLRVMIVRLVMALLISVGSYAQVSLQCEYLQNPLGIDARHPRLQWRLQDSTDHQTQYQLVVGTDSTAVSQGNGNCWQPAVVTSDAQRVIYQGSPLQPFTKYYWTVKVWGTSMKQASVNSFETGMMEASDWKGAWISDSRDVKQKQAPYFRKEVRLSRKVRSARAYIAVGGLYELYINGQRIGNHRLDPMYTRFDRRTLYVTHDVTAAFTTGANAIGVLLGNGWYNHQSTAVWYFHEAPWRARPAFCMDIRITYEDGSVETIGSGKDWKTSPGPLTFNSIYTAEHYDARLEQRGWNEPGFADSTWKEVIFRSAPSSNIVAQVMHPIRNVETIPAKKVTKISDSVWVFDLGRNISGVSGISIQGEAGQVLRLKHAERLYPNGRADLSNIDVHYRPTDSTDPFQTDIVVLSGKGQESFMPRFNYKGFQYVEVTSNRPLRGLTLTGYFMHSDVPAVGSVTSSNVTLNKLWWATNNSYLSNLFGYPTDCPQREKNGWTGDAHVAVETGLYNFDAITVYEKWMNDHKDEQQANGVLPSIIPTSGWGYEWGNGPDWTSTIALIPWNVYLFYGDTTLLSRCYDNIRRYVDHITSISADGLTTWGLGDWVPVKSKTPVEFTSSAYYYTDVSILAKAAALLGKSADAERYTALATKIFNAFNAKYLHDGTYGTGLQTELSVALHWGLVPDSLRASVAGRLAARVKADGNHLDVGLLGTRTILNALSDNGYADVAYTLASQETYPSWGWWIVNGATTLYENWPIDAKSDISMNHIMFGEIGAWMYKGLGGIFPDAAHPGFKHVLLRPNFVKGLNQFEASHESMYGRIVSSWRRSGKKILYDVVIPPGSTATLQLKTGTKTLKAGKYHFELR